MARTLRAGHRAAVAAGRAREQARASARRRSAVPCYREYKINVREKVRRARAPDLYPKTQETVASGRPVIKTWAAKS